MVEEDGTVLGALVGAHLLSLNKVIRLKDWLLLEVMDFSVFPLLCLDIIRKPWGIFQKAASQRKNKNKGVGVRGSLYLLFEIKVLIALTLKAPGH